MSQKTVLITGGAGFLGSHLCDLFLARDLKVVAVDNFLTGSEKNIAHLAKETRFTLIHQDVSKHIDYAGPVDYVLHFASFLK